MALATFLFSFAYSSTARALIIYNWTGNCTFGCVGVATSTLTLNDSFMPGVELDNADFVSLTYLSSSGAFSIPADLPLDGISGKLPALSGFATNDVFIDPTGSGTFHVTTTAGTWLVEWGPLLIMDGGLPYTWTRQLDDPVAMPEPSALTLFGAGLLGLALMARRRRKAA